jgi:antitoxin (DNA-binding transcriptional repressor) of toxin-antitoxin stability system
MARVKIDIDGNVPKDFAERLRWTMMTLGLRVDWWNIFRTRRGWHIEVAVKGRLNVARIVAIQAILGSDPRRETFNLARTAGWRYLDHYARSRWNVLFDRKLKL